MWPEPAVPDSTGKTISATQAPALWNASPWLTRWMLHQHFTNGMQLDKAADARMSWGLKLQPLILEQAAEDLSLEIRPNEGDIYERRGLFGCTRDAIVIDPTLGTGALETKVVFDYRDWMSAWDGGRTAPRHYEIQLQEQMLVGDGETGESFRWGVIAVWVAGEVHYLRRDPVEELWKALRAEAEAFFAAVAAGAEPDPFGLAVELPMLNAIERTGEVIDLTDDVDIAEEARMFNWAKTQARSHSKIADSSKVKLLKALGDASEAECFGGIRLKVSQSKIPASTRDPFTRTVLSASVPSVLPDELMDTVKKAELTG